MTKEQKTAVKEKAEKVATFLGYNMGETATEMLHAINLREMYCQGYSQAMVDNPSTPSIEYAIGVLEELLTEQKGGTHGWDRNKTSAKIQELKYLLK